MNIEETLTELGYSLSNHGYYYSTNAVYRQGSNPTSLTIYPNKNLVVDWVTGQRMSIHQLIQSTLKLPNLNQVEEWLKNKNVIIENKEEKELEIKEQKTFPLEWAEKLVPDHSYWLNRGISKEVMEKFKGGISYDIPGMKGKYCFIIWNSKKQVVGFQGRSLNGKNPKYKIMGEKSNFCFPLHLNMKEIRGKSEIILIEGISDGLSIETAGITNWMSLFGVSLSNYQLSTIIAINPKKIILALNNDGKAGNEGAEKLKKRLCKFFDKNQISVKLPKLKDLNEELIDGGIERIKDWYARN